MDTGRPPATNGAYEGHVVDVPPGEFRVRTNIYVDPQVFDDEMRNIFETSWVYVGHESEIPNPGDFKTAAIGRLPVILSRDEGGGINVLLNICRHRGSTVCNVERGNARQFECPYHAWVYDLKGALTAVSSAEGYPDNFQQSVGGLVRIPRVATYRQMVFASVAESGESLEDHLGPVREHVDYWFDQSPTGNVRLLPPKRAMYPANWKFQLENTTDGWHARYVHASAFNTMRDFELRDPAKAWLGATRGFPRGHGILERPLRYVFEPDIQDAYMSALAAAHGKERAEKAHYGRHITLFPNLHLMEFKFRVVQPVAVDKTIVYEFPIEFEGVDEEVNIALGRKLDREGSLASGFVNSDDVEIFGRVQSGLRAAHMMEWFHLSRGMNDEQVLPSGERVAADYYELPQRALYREWSRLMTGAE